MSSLDIGEEDDEFVEARKLISAEIAVLMLCFSHYILAPPHTASKSR